MKWLAFSIILAFFVFNTANIAAQENSGYDGHVQEIKKEWNRLIPRYVKMQYAGSMGLISAGVGWQYGKNKQWETDVMLGYIPKYTTDEAKACLTLKQNFIPWKIQLKDSNYYFDPLSAGFYISSVLDDDFWIKDPKKYPSKYYPFATKIRLNICVGQRIAYKIPAEKRTYLKSIALFYEISSNELYILEAFGDSHFKPTNYLHLSLGVKFLVF
ncbi:MAG: hypothetical protein LBR75_04595 [Prevotellaceae bacterium]|jgi:hypothetical protein|nr:hypothetical protein [Prevotellaceae bacterium]